MFKRVVLFGLIASMVVLAGCDDDEECTVCPEPSIDLYGKWQIISGDLEADWLLFYTDNTYHELYENDYGFRSINSDVCMITEDQVIMDWGQVLNYRISNDTLCMTRPSYSITAVRDNDGPADSAWIEYLPSLGFVDEMDAPIPQVCDIGFDGQHLWYGNGYASNYLYVIDTGSLSAIDSLSIGHYALAVESDGSSLWCSSNGSDRIYEVSPTTGATISSSTTMGAWIEGIAWDGEYLWCGSHNEETIYQYDPVEDSVLDTFLVDVMVHGMAWVGDVMYVCTEGILNVCTVNGTLEAVAAYRMRDADIEGVAYDGSWMWLMVNTEQGYKIYRYSWVVNTITAGRLGGEL